MGTLCEKLLTACISADCNNPIFKGVASVAYIFNRSDIASINYNASDPHLIDSITMKDNGATPPVYEVGYKIQQFGKTPFSGTSTALVESSFMNKFTNNVQFIVPDNSPAAAAILDNLANGDFVVVLKNDYEGADGKGKFQVYGAQKGLKASATETEKYNDIDGSWQITLTEEEVSKSALFIEHKTDNVVDTEEYLEGLVDCE